MSAEHTVGTTSMVGVMSTARAVTFALATIAKAALVAIGAINVMTTGGEATAVAPAGIVVAPAATAARTTGPQVLATDSATGGEAIAVALAATAEVVTSAEAATAAIVVVARAARAATTAGIPSASSGHAGYER